MPDDDQAKKRGILHSIVSLVIMVVAIFVFAWLLRTFVFQSYQIPSESMEDTILKGDMVFSEKVSYYLRDPQAGEIITFEDPEIPSRTLIKRVIATEGQTVSLQDGYVYVDGQRLDESYTSGEPSYPLDSAYGSEEISYPYTVPEGEVWVMGDNRTNSSDSRYFGSIPISSITGHAALIYWPLDRISTI